VSPQHTGHLLHWLQTAAHGPFTQASRKPDGHRTDLYFQNWPKAYLSSKARAVASLLANSAVSCLRALPRTRQLRMGGIFGGSKPEIPAAIPAAKSLQPRVAKSA